MAPTRSTGEARDDAQTEELAAELRAAVGGDAAREALFWRGRADELASRLESLQERLLALAGRLPARYARLLTCEPEQLGHEPEWPDPLVGWRETTSLEDASVSTELPRLWRRLGPPAPR